ncbi:hypothetical protein [Congregibacter sp.]|jgi:predicted enzyme related to lactoylglutathione lyase|uniref:hypothetical protein n=1 Tax=Congregibacter sp. TaxID=2744308 RepID=UPI0039E4F0BD
MNVSHQINYFEFPARDIAATKQFFADVFAWTFEDFGPDYTSFSDQGLDGGFSTSEFASRSGQTPTSRNQSFDLQSLPT